MSQCIKWGNFMKVVVLGIQFFVSMKRRRRRIDSLPMLVGVLGRWVSW